MYPQASAPYPDRRVLKQQLIRVLLVSQAREVGSTVVVIGMWAEPSATEAGVS